MIVFRMLRSVVVVLIPLMALLLPVGAWAQTTGNIKGTVIDEGGLSVPGVLMTVSSPALIGGAQQETTDDAGRFLFTNLPPGLYTVRAEKAGFGTVEYPNQQVLLGKSIILNIELKMQTAGMEVEVTDERPAIDTESAARGTVMTKEFLQLVPNSRSYQSVVSAAPGVQRGSNPSMGGAAYNENTYMIDGVNVTDAVTGTFSLNFNFDAIQQIEVITGAFDPEYPSNLGGIINIVTDSGTNQLEFDTSIFYESGNWAPKIDARFAADGAPLAPTGFDSEFSTMSFNGKVSGPIIRDKAWFVVSYSMSRSLIANTGIDLPRDYEGHYVYAKLTTQPNAANRVVLTLQADPTTVDNTNQSNAFVKPEAQSRQAQGNLLASLQWDVFPTPNIIVESKAIVQRQFIESYGVPCTHNQDLGYHPCEPDEVESSYDFATPARVGTNYAFSSQNYSRYYFDDRDRTTLQSKVSLLQQEIPILKGSHDIKAGVEASFLQQDQVQGINSNLYYVDWNQVSYDPGTFENYYWLEYSGAYDVLAGGRYFGAFIQDVYKPISNLTLRYGVRWDRSVMNSNVNEAIVNTNVLGPRFYVIWDPFGDGKTKVSGGYGRFNAIGNLGIAGDLYSSSGFGSKLYLGEAFGQFANNSSNNYSITPNENTLTVNEHLTAPHSDEFGLGGERLLIQDVVLGANFSAKFTRNVYTLDEVNVIWDEDGYSYVGVNNGEAQSYFRLRTPSVARRDYYQNDLYLRKNFADRWLAQATYSYIVSRGTALESSQAGLAVPPQAEYSYGNLDNDVRHQVKLQGGWQLPNDPWTTELGISLQYYSGYPVSRYYYSGGYGSYALLLESAGEYARIEPRYYIDLQVAQSINVPKGELNVIGTLQNAINAHQGVTVSADYLYTQNRWVLVTRQNPITARLGLQYKF